MNESQMVKVKTKSGNTLMLLILLAKDKVMEIR